MRPLLRISLGIFLGSLCGIFLSGCGGSNSNSTTGGGGGGTVSPAATYIYVINGATNPEVIARYSSTGTGSPAAGATIALPSGFAADDLKTDSSGNLYVCGEDSRGNSQVLVYAPAGTLTQTLSLNDDGALAIDSSGQLYVLGIHSSTVYVYAAGATGTPVPTRSFTSAALQSGGGSAIAVDGSKNVYVVGTDTTSPTDASILYEFSSTATGASATPTRTLALTGMSLGVAVDNAGNIYTTNITGSPATSFTSTIQEFGSSSTPTRTITPTTDAVSFIYGLGVDSAGYIYAELVSGSTSQTTTNALIVISPSQNGAVTPAYRQTPPLSPLFPFSAPSPVAVF